MTAQGSGSFNRIGNKIAMQSLRLKGIVTTTFTPAATTGATVAQTWRVVVVYDKTPSGALPTFDAIFGSIENDGDVVTGFLTNLLLTKTKRFRVLKDCVMTASAMGIPSAIPGTPASSTYTSQIEQYIDEFVPLKGLETQYTATQATPAITDISSGGLYVYLRASDNGSGAQSTSQNMSARLRFQP